MQVLQALTALSLSIGSSVDVEPLQPVFNTAVSVSFMQDNQDDSQNPDYYRLKKSGKSGWGGASPKHWMNDLPYTI